MTVVGTIESSIGDRFSCGEKGDVADITDGMPLDCVGAGTTVPELLKHL